MKDKNVCPECEGRILEDYETGEKYCESCGLVISETKLEKKTPRGDTIDERKKKKHYEKVHDEFNVQSHKTQISDNPNGNTNHNQNQRNWRLSYWHKIMSTHDNQNLKHSLNRLKGICKRLNIPKVSMADIANYYKKTFEDNMTQGRMEEVVLASVIYLICRRDSIPVTTDELAEAVNICPKQITRFYKKLKRGFDIHPAPQDTIKFIERYTSELDTSQNMTMKAKNIMKDIQPKLTGKKPSGIAGGCIYYVCNQSDDGKSLTLRDVADEFNVSTDTLAKRRDDIDNILEGEG